MSIKNPEKEQIPVPEAEVPRELPAGHELAGSETGSRHFDAETKERMARKSAGPVFEIPKQEAQEEPTKYLKEIQEKTPKGWLEEVLSGKKKIEAVDAVDALPHLMEMEQQRKEKKDQAV